jgi:hypothetical protein
MRFPEIPPGKVAQPVPFYRSPGGFLPLGEILRYDVGRFSTEAAANLDDAYVRVAEQTVLRHEAAKGAMGGEFDRLKAIPDLSNKALWAVFSMFWRNAGYPVWWTTSSMCQALAATDPPTGLLQSEDVNWPRSSGLFLLPLRDWEERRTEPPKPVALRYSSRRGNGLWFCEYVTIDQKIYATEADYKDEVDLLNRGPESAGLLLNLVLVMNQRPQLVESRMPVRTVKTGRGKAVLWEPAWIGRKYKIIHDNDGSGSHASPRSHWRNGHWRMQPYGERNEQRKLIWIEPMLVNANVA